MSIPKLLLNQLVILRSIKCRTDFPVRSSPSRLHEQAGKPALPRYRYLTHRGIKSAVIDSLAVGTDELHYDRVFARGPAREPDRLPLVDVAGLAVINGIS